MNKLSKFAPLLQRGVDGNYRNIPVIDRHQLFAPLLQRGVDGNSGSTIYVVLYATFAPLLQRGVDGNCVVNTLTIVVKLGSPRFFSGAWIETIHTHHSGR